MSVNAAIRAAALAAVLACASTASAQPGFSSPGTIAYVISEYKLANLETDKALECPQGFNSGQQEYLAAKFPDAEKRNLTYEETYLKLHGSSFFPEQFEEAFPYREAAGPTAIGLNLDGKVGPEDFTSPEGVAGVDNQLFRATGCIEGWRNLGTRGGLNKQRFQRNNYNRLLIEITGVDSLENDPEVTVNTYRGLTLLMLDGTNKPVVGRTQRIDTLSGERFLHSLRGRIVNGVLITDPGRVTMPYSPMSGKILGKENQIMDARFQLKLRPDGAEGLVAGYFDVEDWYWRNRSNSLDFDKIVNGALYRALKRLADAYPAADGSGNTAISGAIQVKFVQAYIQHPDRGDVVAGGGGANPDVGVN